MVRTRIAPSPTGEDLHIGNLYTALINWAVARKNNGKFVVRIEDTDRKRFVKVAEEQILASLSAFGLSPDESPKSGGEFGPYRQSERLDVYKKYAEELIEKKAAYYCNCSPERLEKLRNKQQAEKKIPRYDKRCLKNPPQKGPFVVRLNVPEEGATSFDDVIHGFILIENKIIDDQVLLKSDGFPTYHLAVVVDDYLMKISHVIRAEEWISSTPKHILLYEALGWEKPIFAHLPILRNPDRSKLSKRKNPVWASWYLKEGFLPEAVLNYLALMGWSHPEQKEIFSIEEFINVFDLKDVKSVGPVFDVTKLEWMNGAYIRELKVESLKLKVLDFIGGSYSDEIVKKTISLIQERIKKLSDYLPFCEFFFQKPEKYELDLSKYSEMFKKVVEKLSTIDSWKADLVGEIMQTVAKEIGIKNSEFFMAIRVAISGKKISPPLNESMEILGKEECLQRIKKIYEK